jgi:hypothetical protein
LTLDLSKRAFLLLQSSPFAAIHVAVPLEDTPHAAPIDRFTG